MHPLRFVKEHPVATIVLMSAGMVVGPAILGGVSRYTGVNVSLPTVGSRGE